MISTCYTIVSDADGIFAEAIRIFRELGHLRLANELDLIHLEFRERGRFRDEMTEEGREAERLLQSARNEEAAKIVEAKVVNLKPFLALIQGGES